MQTKPHNSQQEKHAILLMLSHTRKTDTYAYARMMRCTDGGQSGTQTQIREMKPSSLHSVKSHVVWLLLIREMSAWLERIFHQRAGVKKDKT